MIWNDDQLDMYAYPKRHCSIFIGLSKLYIACYIPGLVQEKHIVILDIFFLAPEYKLGYFSGHDISQN